VVLDALMESDQSPKARILTFPVPWFLGKMKLNEAVDCLFFALERLLLFVVELQV